MRTSSPKIARLADWHRIKGIYGVNTRVQAVVVRHVGLGAICRVEDRIPAVLRKREFSWNPDEHHAAALAANVPFQAVVVEHDNDRRQLIISKRAADPNPLEFFYTAHPDGTVVEGRVVRALPNSGDLLLALDGGVAGLAPQHTIPRLRASAEITGPWEVRSDDRVRGRVTGVDRAAGHVRLNLEAARAAAELDMPQQLQLLRIVPNVVADTRPAAEAPAAPHPPPLAPLTVLVVENDADISGPLSYFLRGRGHAVTIVDRRAEADRLLANPPPFDVVLIDLQLNGDHGGGLIRAARQKLPRARVYLFTGNSAVAHYPEHEFADGVIEKPIDTHRLVAVIEGRGRAEERARPPLDEGVVGFLGGGPADVGAVATGALVDAHLRAAMDVFPRVAAAAVLAQDAAKSEVRCLRALGAPADAFVRYGKQLTASPVEDVLVDSRPLRYNLDRATAPPAFVGWMNGLRATTVLGLPISAETAPLPLGLFVFLPDQIEPGPDALTRLQLRADALAVVLDRAVLDAQLLQHQRALCAGGLLLALTHELANEIHAPLALLSVLRDVVGEPGRATAAEQAALVDAAAGRMRGLKRTFEEILATAKAKGGGATTTLAAALAQVCESTASAADHNNVGVYVRQMANPRVRDARVPVALQQALLNLILNAIQHTGAYRVANTLQHGFVEVYAGLEQDDDADWWVTVRVRDNGPGLDGDSFERAFDMYHTTRRQGSGLGLYVTRRIVESAGGSVAVERSVKFFETVFVVRVPFA